MNTPASHVTFSSSAGLQSARGLAHSKSWRNSNARVSSARSWSAVALYRFACDAPTAFMVAMRVPWEAVALTKSLDSSKALSALPLCPPYV